MDVLQNLVEYYDELYPVTPAQQTFYDELIQEYAKPAHFLNVSCGTGVLEHRLAKDGADVTGLETNKELMESANRKHRNQLMSVRYFMMSTIEMSRFLGKGFYNVISCLNDRIIFIHDHVLLQKFFYDCKQLLAPQGKLIISLCNYSKYKTDSEIEMPSIESMRVSLHSKLYSDGEASCLSQTIETGSGKKLPVMTKESVYPLTTSQIRALAEEAGFSKVELYSGFDKTPFTPESDRVLIVIS
ncbi:MAG: methyltransferase domain-containing protein [Treponema sp.]|nr:methyltransferase domain-containing protein [Treponema sp.]